MSEGGQRRRDRAACTKGWQQSSNGSPPSPVCELQNKGCGGSSPKALLIFSSDCNLDFTLSLSDLVATTQIGISELYRLSNASKSYDDGSLLESSKIRQRHSDGVFERYRDATEEIADLEDFERDAYP